MDTQEELLSSQIQSVLEAQIWFPGISSMLGIISFILIFIAIIILYIKTKAPGSLLMLVGITMASILILSSMFMVFDLRHMNSAQANIFWITQLTGYFFIFLTSFGFIKFVLKLKKPL